MAASDRISLGSAIFALIDPHRGHERDFNRWYERDHLYAGGLCAPWTLAAARWVATRDLKALRYPRNNPICDPIGAGSYLSAFWIQAGRFDEQQAWVREQMQQLGAAGRLFGERQHVHTFGYAYRGCAHRDADAVPAELALDHRYPGVVCSWIERNPEIRLDDLSAWLVKEFLPVRLESSPLAMALTFELLPPQDWWPANVPQPPGLGDRLLVAHFLESDPRECWAAGFADLGDALEASGQGRLLLAAPFIPTRPGTDAYVDELW